MIQVKLSGVFLQINVTLNKFEISKKPKKKHIGSIKY